MLDIMKTENALYAGNIQDKVIADNLHEMLNAAMQMDKSSLKLAYHAACIKPRLEGNVEGFPTKFEEFAEKKLGVKRAQAFNMLAVGEATVRVLDSEVYLDKWTYENLLEECTANETTDWEMLKKLARSRKTLGTTKVLTVLRLLNKYDMHDEDVRAYLTDRKNGAYSNTVKEFEKALKEPFNLLPDKEDKTKKDETKEKATETTAETTAENTAETTTEETAKDITIPVVIAKNAYPVIARYAEESKELASLLHYLNGFPEIVG